MNPDKKHYAMAMFACVTANQCTLAGTRAANAIASRTRVLESDRAVASAVGRARARELES
jgi:hypothetical protein